MPSSLSPSVGQSTCELLSLSFAAATGYHAAGGFPLLADHSSTDLASLGLQIPRDLLRNRTAVAAFLRGASQIRIKIRLAIDSQTPTRILLRARCGNEIRIPETSIQFTDGFADADLPVLELPTSAVGTITENWRFEYRAGWDDFLPIHSVYAGNSFDAFPVRLYIVAAPPLGGASRESYYHVGCAVSGAQSQARVERDIWKHFTAFRHNLTAQVTNAAGQPLGFWRERKPGMNQADYIARNAQDLVTTTDSSCRGWAELLREAFAAHGIAATVRAVQPKLSRVHPLLGLPTFLVPDGSGGQKLTRTIGILVKPFQWKPANQLSPFPFAAGQSTTNFARFLWKIDNAADTNAARWPDPDVTDLQRPSHDADAARAPGLFGNHAVVLVTQGSQQRWYDPSFGFGPHPSLQSYEDELLGRGEENHGGLFAIVGYKHGSRFNPATGQTLPASDGLLLAAAPPPPGPLLEAVDPG